MILRTGGSVFWTGLGIALKESGKRLVPVLLLLGCAGALVWSVLSAQNSPAFQVRVALVNEDSSDMGAQLPLSLLQNAAEGVSVDVFPNAAGDFRAYAAVLTIPEGYTAGILSGENVPLDITLNRASPLEALWVRQMTEQGLAALGQGQLAVQAASQSVGTSMNDLAFGLLVLDLNSSLLRAFSGGEGMLGAAPVRVTGRFTLVQYGAVSLFIAGVMGFGYVYAPAVGALGAFPKRRISAEGASVVHVILLVSLLCFGLAAGLYGFGKFSVLRTGLAGVVLGGYVWGVCRLFRGNGVIGMGLSFVQMVCSGGIIPLALLPGALGRVAIWTPFYWVFELLRPV